MPDIAQVNNTKDKIMSVIRVHGPSYPTRVAHATGISPLFVSAFLAELVSDRKLKMSNMKVGSSPLYYIPEQEAQLERFSNYLNQKEKEAFMLLQQNKILQDDKQHPAIRVALRKLSDFAQQVNVTSSGETKTFWKYFLMADEDAGNAIRDIVSPPIIQRQEEKKEEVKVQELKVVEEIKPIPIKIKEEVEVAAETIKEEKPKKAKKQKAVDFKFANKLKDYLLSKEIEILDEILVKKNEFHAKVSLDTPFGRQEYFLTAKDKKKITEDDLAIAVHKAQSEKMPALFISKGEVDKNAMPYLQSWKNLIKVEKAKL